VHIEQFPKLETERLALVYPSDDYLADYFEMHNHIENNKYLNRKLFNSKAEAHQKLEKLRKGISAEEYLFWIITTKVSKEAIGSICLWNYNEKTQQAEIGYELIYKYTGQGYMREALMALKKYVWNSTKFVSLVAYTNPKNLKSIALLSKNGFEFQETIEEKFENNQERGYLSKFIKVKP